MDQRRWWDVVIPVIAAAIGAPVIILVGQDEPGNAALALAALVAYVLTYVVFGRGLFCDDSSSLPRWRVSAFVVTSAAALAVGVYAAPFLAMLQTIAYPLVWVLTPGRRSAICGSLAVGSAIFVGFWARGGFTASSFWDGLISGGIAVVFAISLGLWITSIAEHGARHARLAAELTAAQGQIEVLSRDRGALDERERIARDIHDTLAQTLAGLVLLSERAGRQAREGRTDAAVDTIGIIEGVAREALAESRALVARMAAVPADPAFAAAVERLAARFRAEAGFAVDVSVASDVDVHRDAQVVLLRCLQESLSNVRKHARASVVDVEVEHDGEETVMRVRDNGVGFDPDAARTGFGLDGLADRVALAGGTISVTSRAGVGTTAEFRLPAAHGAEVEA